MTPNLGIKQATGSKNLAPFEAVEIQDSYRKLKQPLN